VLATQQRTLDSLRAIDFDALLLDSLSPVLGERSLPG
jgi:hypothetical protein